jgi:hypothetical protein
MSPSQAPEQPHQLGHLNTAMRRNSFSMPSPLKGGPHVEDDTPRAHYAGVPGRSSDPSDPRDQRFIHEVPNMALLVVLYMMQGVPLGLTMGAMPLLLASKASLTQVQSFFWCELRPTWCWLQVKR